MLRTRPYTYGAPQEAWTADIGSLRTWAETCTDHARIQRELEHAAYRPDIWPLLSQAIPAMAAEAKQSLCPRLAYTAALLAHHSEEQTTCDALIASIGDHADWMPSAETSPGLLFKGGTTKLASLGNVMMAARAHHLGYGRMAMAIVDAMSRNGNNSRPGIVDELMGRDVTAHVVQAIHERKQMAFSSDSIGTATMAQYAMCCADVDQQAIIRTVAVCWDTVNSTGNHLHSMTAVAARGCAGIVGTASASARNICAQVCLPVAMRDGTADPQMAARRILAAIAHADGSVAP